MVKKMDQKYGEFEQKEGKVVQCSQNFKPR